MSSAGVQELVRSDRAHLDRMLDLVRDDPMDPEAQFFFAAWLARAGSLEESLEILNRISKLRPNHPGIWLFKATVLDQLGDAKKARACRARAEQFLHPDEAPPPSPAKAIAKAMANAPDVPAPRKPVRPVAKRRRA
jgi:Flp pilus assembly protein TadD